MRETGFLLVDGNAALGRAPAVPRHWLAAAAIVIVAQWLFWQGDAAAQLLAVYLVERADPELGGYAMANLAALTNLLYLTLPSVVAVGFALHLSWRVDKRSAKAIGLDVMTAVTAAVWLFAGLGAALPAMIAIALSSPDLAALAQGAAVLTPVTIVQAGAEEVVFRGIVLASLVARYGVRTGLLISAILFGLWHVVIGQSLFDGGVAFASTFVFGITAGVLTLHYGNLGPALGLHVVWNVASYLAGAAMSWETDFWTTWVSRANEPWTYADIQDGDIFKFLVVPLLFETLFVVGACRETISRLISTPRPATAERALQVSPNS